MNQQKSSSTDKNYSLSEVEVANIESRQGLIKQYQYIIHVINSDIKAYIEFSILPRLGIKEGQTYKLSEDNKTVTIFGGKDENKKTS